MNSNHRTLDAITKEQLAIIKSGVLKHYRCINDEMILDILFIIEYLFGFKDHCIPDDYMYEILEDVFK